jgi:hypothetical protein
MSAKTLSRDPAVSLPAPPLAPEAPAPEGGALFPPSAELGDQLDGLAQAQADIDHRRAEELARLRQMQDRD